MGWVILQKKVYTKKSIILNCLGASYKIDEIVDIGAGLGHLSRILSLLFNFKVTTIEGNEQVIFVTEIY